MKCWVEYCSELYTTENTVTEEALDAVERMPIMEDLDTKPFRDEMSKVIDTFTTGKAPIKDGIPSEILNSASPCKDKQ